MLYYFYEKLFVIFCIIFFFFSTTLVFAAPTGFSNLLESLILNAGKKSTSQNIQYARRPNATPEKSSVEIEKIVKYQGECGSDARGEECRESPGVIIVAKNPKGEIIHIFTDEAHAKGLKPKDLSLCQDCFRPAAVRRTVRKYNAITEFEKDPMGKLIPKHGSTKYNTNDDSNYFILPDKSPNWVPPTK